MVEVQDCRIITDHFSGIYRIYPNLIKANQRMSTCNQLDLQTLGSQPVIPKNLPDHWLANPNKSSRCFPHNFQNSYEYLIHNQSDYFDFDCG